MYNKVIKRVIDFTLSSLAIILFSWLFIIVYLSIIIDDPGPAIFKQKRFGKCRAFFFLHKFRTMKNDAPHDIPTHLLKNPNKYITKVGRFLRRTSLDELPQLFDILLGNMSIIGPRPALWNQEDLLEERERYGANGVRPGLTGWAQINGRDELKIAEKAKLDGEYVKILNQGGVKAFLFDCKCFIFTIFKVVSGDGIAEGDSKK